MSEENHELDMNNLLEVVSELQQEVRLIKDEIEKLKMKTLIDKLHVFIENTEEQFGNIKKDIDTQKQDIEQIKQSQTKNVSRRPSEYRQLQKMLQSAQQTEATINSMNSTNKLPPAKVEITSIHSSNKRQKRNR
ncbi:hypothetical protein [Gracilibacillus kekensis]|uniref:Uncharacterized protein n=1 Tax=Gracilibacillus kekensis TaxID=1027249 RepID=A0A1M7NTH4_9BACI|nr:hypothetical protein [Gracilibacillus kekensis]SHN07203.1 hypothetical protein SAMN05216179_1747 [Gracilibacillus kekensis]